ncbi:MAG TPA: TIGR02270 family protein [Povalibacter sp.]|uniref:TIGR02270 family protein n=1 Tax=Povalibacter sp. TaxID=1962978 RepID=UPI002B563DD1|nr:TIGR02270 family protein [Povalibacter sp.]HMN43941.1 TIGR02270 family protein [Povalibacter sp.]
MSSASSARSPLPDLIEESFDEATFLWQRWEAELTSLTRNLDEVWSWTEDRLHGALAGVHVLGDGLIDFCRPHLASDDPRRITVATALLASRGSADVVNVLSEALTDADAPKLAAMARGLETTGSSQVLSSTAGLLAGLSPAHQATLCRIKTARSARPGPELAAAFAAGEAGMQIAALRAVRFAASEHLDEWVGAGLRTKHPQARLTAIEAGIARNVPAAWTAAIDAVGNANAELAPVLRLIAMLGGAEHHALIHSSLRVPQLQAQALWALGHVGTRHAVELCLQGMKHEKLARSAAEAYCHITGADLARDHLAAAETPAETPAFEADDLEADLVPAQESLWPLPDADAVRRHWEQHQASFQPDVRYIRGQPASVEALLGAIETGPMLRRPDLVLNLAAKTQGAYDVETRSFAARQRIMMARGRSALAGAR